MRETSCFLALKMSNCSDFNVQVRNYCLIITRLFSYLVLLHITVLVINMYVVAKQIRTE